MSFTHTMKKSWSGAGRTIVSDKSFTASSQTSLKETIASGVQDQNHVIAIDVTAVKSIYIHSDQDIKLETNSGSVPDDTLLLKANVPYVWNPDEIDVLKLTVDVTSIHVSNDSPNTATLEIEVLQDATP